MLFSSTVFCCGSARQLPALAEKIHSSCQINNSLGCGMRLVFFRDSFVRSVLEPSRIVHTFRSCAQTFLALAEKMRIPWHIRLQSYCDMRLMLFPLLLLAVSVKAAVLPAERLDVLYHKYDGGGVEIDGPSILVRKNVGDFHLVRSCLLLGSIQMSRTISIPMSRNSWRSARHREQDQYKCPGCAR